MWQFITEYKFVFAIGFLALVSSLLVKWIPHMLSLFVLILCSFYLICSLVKPERSVIYTWRFTLEFFLVYSASYIGLKCYRFMTLFQRLMFIQVCLYLFFYLFTWYVKFNQLAHDMRANTIQLFDFYLPLETAILLFTPVILLKRWFFSFAVTFVFVLFLFIHLLEIYNREAKLFDGFSIVTQNMLVTICYLLILYNYFSRNTLNWNREQDVWLLSGLIIYSACIIPYCSIMDQLETANSSKMHLPDKNTNTFLYYFIVGAFANIRYGCMTITFYLLYTYQTKEASS